MFRREDWTHTTEATQGWQANEDEWRLIGWSRARRVMVLPRRIKQDVALTAKKKGKKEDSRQLMPALSHDEVQDNAQLWEYTVPVTDASCELASVRPALPRPLRLREQVRRVEKPMGLGRFHHA